MDHDPFKSWKPSMRIIRLLEKEWTPATWFIVPSRSQITTSWIRWSRWEANIIKGISSILFLAHVLKLDKWIPSWNSIFYKVYFKKNVLAACMILCFIQFLIDVSNWVQEIVTKWCNMTFWDVFTGDIDVNAGGSINI